MAKRHCEVFLFPQTLQRINHALARTLAEQWSGDKSFFAQLTGAFQEDKAINASFLNDLTSHTWQFISHLKEGVHVALGTLMELLVNRQRTAIHTVPSAFRKEG